MGNYILSIISAVVGGASPPQPQVTIFDRQRRLITKLEGWKPLKQEHGLSGVFCKGRNPLNQFFCSFRVANP